MLILSVIERKGLENVFYINHKDGVFNISLTPSKGLPFSLPGNPRINRLYITLNEANDIIFFGRMVGGLFITIVKENKDAWRKQKLFTINYSSKQLGECRTPQTIYRKLINRILIEDTLGFHRFYLFKNIAGCYEQEERLLLTNYNQSLDLYGAFDLNSPSYIIYNRTKHLIIPIDINFRANLFIAKNKLR